MGSSPIDPIFKNTIKRLPFDYKITFSPESGTTCCFSHAAIERGYVVQPDKLPNYVVPDLTGFKLKPYVSQCAIEVNKTNESTEASK